LYEVDELVTHFWLVQACVEEQALHVAPPVPHTESDVPAWQTPFESQHPELQLVESHAVWQAPEEHSCEDEHVEHSSPPVPQAELAVPLMQ
jgi:hypothetical protein